MLIGKIWPLKELIYVGDRVRYRDLPKETVLGSPSAGKRTGMKLLFMGSFITDMLFASRGCNCRVCCTASSSWCGTGTS